MQMPEDSHPPIDRAALTLAGASVFALALAVLVGWMSHSGQLIQILPSFTPMPINTALSLAGAGCALIFAGMGRVRITAMLGGLSSLVGAVGSYPGQWFVSTHLAFAVAGVGFAVFAMPTGKLQFRLHGWTGSVIATLAIAVFADYAMGVSRSIPWAPHTHMAAHAALAFLILGAVFIFLGWKPINTNLPYVLVMCLGALVAFEIHMSLIYVEEKFIRTDLSKPWLPWAASGAVVGFAALLGSLLRGAIQRTRIIEETVRQRTAQLEKSNQALEEEIRQRRMDEARLEEQRKNLEKTNIELDSFVYTASHDLRAPLRAIASFAAFLKEDCGPQLGAEGKDHLEEIQKGAVRMNQLIDDLLTLSRMSRVRNPYEPVAVRDVVRFVLDRLSFDIQSASAEVIVAPDLPTIFCDRVKLTEVFFNLISNGIKFSCKRPGIRGRAEVGWRDRGDLWEFFVKDNGIGIDPSHHEQIFGIFKRLHVSEAYEGTGVGLSIVKRIVEDQGGRVWVESQPGQGAVFYFTLPKTPEEKSL